MLAPVSVLGLFDLSPARPRLRNSLPAVLRIGPTAPQTRSSQECPQHFLLGLVCGSKLDFPLKRGRRPAATERQAEARQLSFP